MGRCLEGVDRPGEKIWKLSSRASIAASVPSIASRVAGWPLLIQFWLSIHAGWGSVRLLLTSGAM